jgi:hypothetical protein
VSIEERITSLQQRHRELDLIIEQEQQRPWPDDPLIKNLKRQKLRIKDKIAAIETAPTADDRSIRERVTGC